MKALLFRSRLNKPVEVEISKLDDMKQILGSQFSFKQYHSKNYFFIAYIEGIEKKGIKNYNRWNLFGAFIIFKSKKKDFIDLDSLTEQDILSVITDDIKRQHYNEEKNMLLKEFTSTFTSVILSRKTYEGS